MLQNMKYAVVTVSDSCSSGNAEDTSGPNLVRLIKKKFDCTDVIYRLVPDDFLKIKECLEELISHDVALILTTGGTGFSSRDVTPEATRSVIQREASGLTHAMMSGSLKVTPHAMLSRAISGISNSTLIINFPGSKKASQECFEIIEPTLPHALSVLRDLKADVEFMHKEMQNHERRLCHHNHSNSGVNKIAYRLRSSPYPMLSVEKANSIISQVISSGTLLKEFSEERERVTIDKCLNRVLADDIRSNIPLPPFRASIKDGYAALSSDEVGFREVVQGICAGDYLNLEIKSGQCVRINTGAMVPDSADCVIQVEDTKLVKHSDDGAQELQIEVMVKPKPGQDIREVGSDLPINTLVLTKGTLLGATEIGVLASIGANCVQVYKILTVGVLSTGNELQSFDSELKPGHIYDSNKIMLMNLLKENNMKAIDLGIVHDDYDQMTDVLKNSIKTKCDIIISTGCVSMGDRDILKEILQNELNATIHFGRVNMKPGKPTTFATCDIQNFDIKSEKQLKQKLIFALPGNPVSAFVTFQIFVLPHLKRIAQFGNFNTPTMEVELLENLVLDPRPEYARASASWCPQKKCFLAQTTGNQISSRLASVPQASLLLMLPQKTESKTMIAKGDKVDAIVLNVRAFQ